MKLRTKLQVFAGVATLVSVSLAITGILGVRWLEEDIADKDVAMSALKHSMQADMMHDAVRGDVMRALIAAEAGNRELLDELAGDVREHGEEFEQELKAVDASDDGDDISRLRTQALQLVTSYRKIGDDIVQLARRDIAAAKSRLPALSRDFDELEVVMASLGDAIQAESRAADVSTVQLVQRVKSVMYTGTALAIAFLWIIAIVNTRGIFRQVGGEPADVANVANRIASGDLGGEVPDSGNGSIMAAMSQMQLSLRERAEEVERALEESRESAAAVQAALDEAKHMAEEASRTKSGLNAAQTNVMIADENYNIVYTNASLREMLAVAESDIRKDLPRFSASEVIGTNIDVFHKNPAHQRNMLDGLRSTHKTQLKLGGRTFALIVNPIFDDANKRVGTVVEWQDRTAELAAREAELRVSSENLRIKNALDKCTTNVMIANANNEIVYLNETLKEMLIGNEGEIRKVLPQFDARKLVGVSMDTFHKNPAHQKAMISGLSGSHRTQIKVGPLHFSLIASPIMDEKGERVGTVVEWKDRTLEVAVEDEVANLVKGAVDGDFTRRIPVAGKEGFFKQLAEGMNQLMETSSVGLNEVARVLSALASGDLTETITNEYQGTFGRLKDDANRTVDQLIEIVTNIKESSDLISTASREIASGNTDLSSRTEEQASSLEETASSMEDLATTVKQNAENARQANQLAAGASEVAVRGGEVVDQVVQTMGGISDSSKKIADIIGVIDGIAFQTNILALNAAVEAARAGEQGRGFAVVATEVRNLAQRSAAAAKEIKELITDSVSKVDTGSKLVDQAGKTMQEIVTSVKRVTDIMSEITAASQEQSEGIDQVSTAVGQMDEVTQQNAALVEEAAAAAESLEEQAGMLDQAVARFKLSGRTQERRGPDRATNVERIAPKAPAAKSTSKPAKSKATPPKQAQPKVAASGGGDSWEDF